MAKLEEAHLGCIAISMKVSGAVSLPEPSSDLPPTFSPTSSVDSAIGDSPRPAGNSGKYLAYGGPGFSLASIDAVTGNVDRIPVPLSCAEATQCVAFTQATVLCVSVVGETQVWVGTEAGSLHVFELARNLRFASHSVTTIDGSLLCITSQHSSTPTSITSGEEEVDLQTALRSMRIEILLGTSNGAVAIISGEAVPGGGLKNPQTALRKPRKVLHLGEREGGGEVQGRVNCIAIAQTAGGGEVFWCSYGKMIVVLCRDGWEEMGRVDGSTGHSVTQSSTDLEVVQLVPSDHGMWSAVSLSSTITLWDTELLTHKLTITCCTLCEADLALSPTDPSLQITSLHSSPPYLLVGTSQSDLLIFHLHKRHPTAANTSGVGERETSGVVGYRLVTAEHCSQGHILNIFTNPVRNPDDECRSPFHSSSAPPTSLQVLVVCGPKSTSDISQSTALFFDLLFSPAVSPLCSPLQLPTPTPTRPPSGSGSYYRRCSSVASNCSNSSSSTVRRQSMVLCDGSLPKLSLFSVSPSAHSLLPLRTS